MQPVASIAGRHWAHPTTGKHRATSTSPSSTKTGDRMHNEKSRTAWLHFQQGLPCLSAVAPTPPGAFHAPRVKEKLFGPSYSMPWQLQAPMTGPIGGVTCHLTPVPDPFRAFLCQPGAIAALLRLLRQLSPLPFGMGVSGTHSPNE